MSTNTTVLTPSQVRENFRAAGTSIAAWARANNFNYRLVMKVLGGRSRCFYGNSHAIAVALGMKAEPPTTEQAAA